MPSPDLLAIPFLPYGHQSIDENDIAAVAAVLRGDWLTQGPTVEAFERAFAERVGARHAIACANGTAALHLAMLALGLKAGEAVVVPSITFLATANAVRFVGGMVEFADVDPHSGLMGVDEARAAIARAQDRGLIVRAILPVHLAGQPVDLAGLARLAEQEGLAIIEDACHAIGTRLHGEPVGSCHHTLMAVFSLHPVKTIAAGEGGVITTNDDDLAQYLCLARSHGMSREPGQLTQSWALDDDGQPNPWAYEMAEPGFNYRLSDIHAALALSQLGKLDRFVSRRAELVARYDAAFAGQVRLCPVAKVSGAEPGWHLYPLLVDFARSGKSRAAVMTTLRAAGIGTQVHYIPVHWQPHYRRLTPDLSLPGAEHWYEHCLSLPLFPAMSDGDADRVIAEVLAATRQP